MGDIDVSAEEEASAGLDVNDDTPESNEQNRSRDNSQLLPPEHMPDKIEEVLENGIKFLSGLMEMSTGKPLAAYHRQRRKGNHYRQKNRRSDNEI
ncbi:MAG: hypothetical protein H7843_07055 [Nitrospirota bacterium]